MMKQLQYKKDVYELLLKQELRIAKESRELHRIKEYQKNAKIKFGHV
jgi:hypothetical protein